MTAHEEQEIKTLQVQGLGYRKIAAALGLPVNTVKSYCRRHMQNEIDITYEDGLCKNCGAAVRQLPHHKKKKFCSDRCRTAWWLKHSEKHKTEAQQEKTCSSCGKTFISYPSSKRKYCSRECYYTVLRKECKH